MGTTCCNAACCIPAQRPVQLCEDALARSGAADGIDERVRMVERSLEAARSGAESSMAAAAACRAEGAKLAEHVTELGRKIEPLRHVAAELPVVRCEPPAPTSVRWRRLCAKSRSYRQTLPAVHRGSAELEDS